VLDAPATLAHGIHLDDGDLQRLSRSGTRVVHCPSSNLKLASGLAPVPDLLGAGISVGLAADGAPCNNNLDAFQEMRLAALIHKPAYGPKAMPAQTVLDMATVFGAEAMARSGEIGTLTPGARADITILDLNKAHTTGGDDPVPRIVYSARAADVDTVVVDGQLVVSDGQLLTGDLDEIRAQATEEFNRLLRRTT
jgi:cytosine/adenosine deaminase-related metal-dependent hydrolase